MSSAAAAGFEGMTSTDVIKWEHTFSIPVGVSLCQHISDNVNTTLQLEHGETYHLQL